jgi:hypothetical protein
MGEKGGPFTEADNYIAAKYLASFSDTEGATSRERWRPFHDKVIHNYVCLIVLPNLYSSSILDDQSSHGWKTTAEMDVVSTYVLEVFLSRALIVRSPRETCKEDPKGRK